MNIGFDLDNIFIDTPPFFSKDIIERLYKKRDNGILEYRIPTRPEQLLRKTTHLPPFRPPLKKNIEFLHSLATDSNKLYLISSRFKFLEKETNHLVNKYQFDKIFDRMYFNFDNKQPHIFKDEIIRKLRLDIYVDDDLSLLNYVAKNSPKTKFYLLHPWGKKKGVINNIIPITQLPDIIQKN